MNAKLNGLALVVGLFSVLSADAAKLPAVGVVPTFSMLLGPNPKKCNDTSAGWPKCVANIKVGPGYTDESGTVHSDGCHAIFPHSGFEVAKKAKPKLIWKLVKDSPRTDTHSYRFPINDAVVLNPNDNNDPAYDLDEPGFDDDVVVFKMKDRNRRVRDDANSDPTKRGIHFDFKVVRDDGVTCASRDPVIINKGD